MKAGLDQSEIALRLNISQPTVSRLEKGIGTPEAEHIAGWLAGCSTALRGLNRSQRKCILELLQEVFVFDQFSEQASRELDRLMVGLVTAEIRAGPQVPYFADIAAGQGERQEPRSEPRSYIEVPAGIISRDPQAFALRIVGDSMQPLLLEGDIVVVSPGAGLIEGCIVAAYVEPDGDVVKRYFPCCSEQCELRLRSANPAYEDILLGGSEGRSGRIWGRVLLSQREL
jgi:SOS-response transcriptional repressor LexA